MQEQVHLCSIADEVTQVTISVGTGDKMLTDIMRNHAGLRSPPAVVGVEQSVVVSGCL